METPIEHFREWLDEDLRLTKVNVPTACCLSTIGTDGFPNARFVSVKEVRDNSFIVTGPLNSRKGIEIDVNNKVALTFWWTETERQVRIQGNANHISDQLADRYFSERNRESQIVSIVSKQGQELKNLEALNTKYREIEIAHSNKTIPRPKDWGGYAIDPIRIEFLEFKPTRFHERGLYELVDGQWNFKQIQP